MQYEICLLNIRQRDRDLVYMIASHEMCSTKSYHETSSVVYFGLSCKSYNASSPLKFTGQILKAISHTLCFPLEI